MLRSLTIEDVSKDLHMFAALMYKSGPGI